MTRRGLLRAASSLVLPGLPAWAQVQTASRQAGPSPADPPLLKPRALKPGDTVGLLTPATAVPSSDDLLKAAHTLRFLGLKEKFGKAIRNRLASVSERLDDLHGMFADPAIRAIFCIRGGYGSSQLLDRIDYDLIRSNPKIFAGYSDITAMHLAIHQKTGLVTFHGPMANSRFTPYTLEHFKKVMFKPEPIGTVTNPGSQEELRPEHPVRAVRAGIAKGRLTGGNLSLIAATMGTPYEIHTRNKLLFLEDVGEQTYSIDRMLTQLRLAGKLQAAAGIIFGECSECGPRAYEPSTDSILSLGEVVENFFSPLGVPVLTGLTIGHTADQLTLPLGVMATLNSTKGELTIEEAATV